MSDRTLSQAIVDNAVRWCNNILSEVRSMHAHNLSKFKQEKLRVACLALQDMWVTEPAEEEQTEQTEQRVKAGQIWAERDLGVTQRVHVVTLASEEVFVHLDGGDTWPIDDFLDQWYLVNPTS